MVVARGAATAPGGYRRLLGLTVAVLLIMASGCAERLLRVRTVPGGAEVIVNGELILTEEDGKLRPATTPVDIPFDHYGTFEITVRHPDHYSHEEVVDVPAPFHSYPPIDLFVETLLPWVASTRHEVEIPLRPMPAYDETTNPKLLERMRSLRELLESPRASSAAASSDA